jgi:MFS family permease
MASFAHTLALHSYVHLSGYLEGLGASSVAIGWAFSFLAVAALVSRPLVGRAMDLHGRRVVILLGAVIHIIACSGYLLIHEMGPIVYVVRAVHGIAEGMLFSALITYAADIVPDARRTEGIALFGVSGLLPVALAGALGDVVVTHYGYRSLFVLTIGIAVVALLISLPLRDLERPSGMEPARGFLTTLREPRLMPLWFVGIVFATSLSTLFIFLKTYMLAEKSGNVGTFFGAFAFAAVTLRVTLGWLPDRIGAVRTLYPSVLALALGLLLLALDTTTVSIIVAGLLCGIGHGFAFPILAGLVVARARPSERGAAMTAFTALFHVGVLAGGPSFGLIIDAAGYPAAYLSAAGAVVLGAVGFAWLEARRSLVAP